MEIKDLEKRLKIITYGQTMINGVCDRHLGADVLAELWMIPLERFTDFTDLDECLYANRDVALFRRVYQYVRWSCGIDDKPEWLEENDISKEW